MATQPGLNRKKMAVKAKKDSTIKNEKIKVKTETANTPAKVKGRARLKSNKPLTKTQKTFKAAQEVVERERQARIKAEKALTQVQEDLVAARLEAERQAEIRRVSFVVRITVYEHGQVGRTEIEHVESSRKQNFLSLDGERLVAFMKACTSPTIISEPTIPPIPSTEKAKAPIPGPLRPKSNLIVSEVRVFRVGDPDSTTLILTREEPLIVQARFQLQGPEAQFLTTKESSFEMKIYANEVTSGESKLLTTYSARLIPNVFEYTAPAGVPGLSSGLYRLFTVVILGVPIQMAGFYGKTIIHVT